MVGRQHSFQARKSGGAESGEEVNCALPLGGESWELRQGAESGFPHYPLLLRNMEK